MNIKSLCFFFNFQNVIKWTRLNQVWPSGCMFDTSTLKKDKVCFNDFFFCVCVSTWRKKTHTHICLWISSVSVCEADKTALSCLVNFSHWYSVGQKVVPKGFKSHRRDFFFFLFLISPHSELLSLSSKLWRPWKWQYQILRHREKSQICVWAQMEKSNSRLMLEKKSLLTITKNEADGIISFG